jgi:hypothetical protein
MTNIPFPTVPLGKTQRYRCAVGHEFNTGLASWTTLEITYDTPPQKYSFNYCMVCFGEWAQANWPLTQDPIGKP